MRAFKLSIKSKSLVVTSLGFRFILLMMAIGIAAINTGNNLLYLVLAMMLSMMVISGVLSDSCLSRLRYQRILPDALYAGRPARMTYLLSNQKRIIPSFSLLIEDSIDAYASGSVRDKYFFKLSPHSSQTRSFPIQFDKRGVYPLRGVSFSTRFPFGIFLKIRKEDVDGDKTFVVFPRLFEIRQTGVTEKLPGEMLASRKGNGLSHFQFRPYFRGDDARTIHWKTSAKRQKLMVREFEEEKEKRISIRISNRISGPLSEGDRIRFERGIELAASYASFFIRNGAPVSLNSDDHAIPAGTGAAHLRKILTCLASLSAITAPESEEAPDCPRGCQTILISPLRTIRIGAENDWKIVQPEDIDRLPYWKEK
jgi:uncharacterized protein (DUF58 family)